MIHCENQNVNERSTICLNWKCAKIEIKNTVGYGIVYLTEDGKYITKDKGRTL